jgi:hypothetical protein
MNARISLCILVCVTILGCVALHAQTANGINHGVGQSQPGPDTARKAGENIHYLTGIKSTILIAPHPQLITTDTGGETRKAPTVPKPPKQ